jgi:hypothetical protein
MTSGSSIGLDWFSNRLLLTTGNFFGTVFSPFVVSSLKLSIRFLGSMTTSGSGFVELSSWSRLSFVDSFWSSDSFLGSM